MYVPSEYASEKLTACMWMLLAACVHVMSAWWPVAVVV
jgi:hypothetical protein